MERNIYKIEKELFVTSDEEIKEDYVIAYGVVIKVMMFNKDTLFFVNGTKAKRNDCKKIILTTDADLIADGIQAIPDEFLEWFVKNPSCEEVKIENFFDYFIISPKEEPKQKCKDCNKSLEDCTFIENTVDLKHQSKQLTKEEVMEQRSSKYEFIDFEQKETLEEAGKQYEAKTEYSKYAIFEAFIEGATWMQHEFYSEEEVLSLLIKFNDSLTKPLYPVYLLKEWFKKFKKK